MKDGAVKAEMAEKMPKSTEEHFDMAMAAILANIAKFSALAIEADNKLALVHLGRAAMATINSALELLEQPENLTEN